MRKRLLVALAIMAIACAGIILWLCRPSDEPSYKGKPLTHWLRGYDYNLYNQWQGPMPTGLKSNSVSQAEEAVRELGTNAIPILCRLIEAKDSALRLETRELLQNSRYKGFFVQHGFLAPAPPATFNELEGFSGLFVLDTNVVGAVPTLIKLLGESPFYDDRETAMAMLTKIGPDAKDAVPALIHLATNPPVVKAGFTPYYISEQALACETLAAIHARPELTVPAMVHCMQDTDRRVRLGALQCIGAFGKEAQSAVPALIEVIKTNRPPNKNADAELKQAAEQVLEKIAPEEAAILKENCLK